MSRDLAFLRTGLLAFDSADSAGNKPGGETYIGRNFLCFHDAIPFCRDFDRQHNEAYILRLIQSKLLISSLKATSIQRDGGGADTLSKAV